MSALSDSSFNRDRSNELAKYSILDSEPELQFDRLTNLAANLFQVPISLISFVDCDRIWLKSHHGVPIHQLANVPGFCPDVVKSNEFYLVEDASTDERTKEHPLVTGEPGVRFYAGAPIITPRGISIGAFNVIDVKPRQISTQEKEFLKAMACIVMDELELRRLAHQTSRDQNALLKIASQVSGLIYQYRLFPDGRSCFPYASRYIAEIYGVEPEEVTEDASKVIAAIHPDDLDRVLATIQQSAKTLQPWCCEYRARYKDGTVRWLYGNSIPEQLPDNSVLWHGFITDITTQRDLLDQITRSESFTRLVTDNLDSFIAYLTLDRRLTFCNRSFSDFLGHPHSEILGRSVDDLLPERSLNLIIPHLEKAYKGERQTIELRNDSTDNAKCYVITFVPDLRNDQVQGLIACATDITLTRRAEKALQVSESMFAAAFEQAAVPMAMGQIFERTVTLIKVNSALCSWLGYAKENLIGKSIIDITHKDDLIEDLAKMEQLRLREITTFSMEKRYLHKNGYYMWGLLSVALVENNLGHENLCIGLVQDINERKKMELALKESEERWKFALEGSGDGAWDLDITTDKLVLSQSWCHFLGLSLQCGLIGPSKRCDNLNISDWTNCIHPEDKVEAKRAFLDHLENKTLKYTNEHRVRGVNGEWRWVLDRGLVVSRDDQGKPLRMVGSVSDITNRKNMEIQLRQAQKLQVVGRLAGAVAHDFNNILTAILLNLEELSRESMGADSDDIITQLVGLSKQGTNLTQQMLMFARQQPIQTSQIDLNQIVHNLAILLKRLIGENIQMQVIAHAQWKSLFVEADPNMLDQVIMNLCINARDAMPDGGVLTLITEQIDFTESSPSNNFQHRTGSYACLSVSDKGCGMTEDVLKHIFEPFFTTKELGKGTGLGLASAYGIIEQHKGWIEAESIPQKGSTFRVYLPVVVDPITIPTQLARLNPPLQTNTGQTILFVEDHHHVRSTTARMLEMMGYKVISAIDGVEALTIWFEKAASIDLLMTDMMMPNGLSGLQLSQRLLKDNPRLGVVLTSGYSDQILDRTVITEQNIVFLSKPYQSSGLNAALRECLERARQPKA